MHKKIFLIFGALFASSSLLHSSQTDLVPLLHNLSCSLCDYRIENYNVSTLNQRLEQHMFCVHRRCIRCADKKEYDSKSTLAAHYGESHRDKHITACNWAGTRKQVSSTIIMRACSECDHVATGFCKSKANQLLEQHIFHRHKQCVRCADEKVYESKEELAEHYGDFHSKQYATVCRWARIIKKGGKNEVRTDKEYHSEDRKSVEGRNLVHWHDYSNKSASCFQRKSKTRKITAAPEAIPQAPINLIDSTHKISLANNVMSEEKLNNAEMCIEDTHHHEEGMAILLSSSDYTNLLIELIHDRALSGEGYDEIQQLAMLMGVAEKE